MKPRIMNAGFADFLRVVTAPALRAVFVLSVSAIVVVVLFALSGYDVSQIGAAVVTGSFTGANAFPSTLRWTIIFVIIGSGVVVAVRSGFFNVGAQGQFLCGSLTSVAVGLAFPTGPAVVVIGVALLAGTVAGAAWAMLPGLLRVRFGTDEVVTTLMMNFIAGLLVLYVTSHPLRDVTAGGNLAATPRLADALRISDNTGVSVTTVLIALLVVAGTWLTMNRTRFGIQATLVGRSMEMARAQGFNVRRIGITAFLISGATAGLAGAVEVFGADGRLVAGATSDIGLTAVVVAVVAAGSIPMVLLAGLFFGALQATLVTLPIYSDAPASSVDVLRGVIALLITAAPVLTFRRRARAISSGEST